MTSPVRAAARAVVRRNAPPPSLPPNVMRSIYKRASPRTQAGMRVATRDVRELPKPDARDTLLRELEGLLDRVEPVVLDFHWSYEGSGRQVRPAFKYPSRGFDVTRWRTALVTVMQVNELLKYVRYRLQSDDMRGAARSAMQGMKFLERATAVPRRNTQYYDYGRIVSAFMAQAEPYIRSQAALARASAALAEAAGRSTPAKQAKKKKRGWPVRRRRLRARARARTTV